VIFRIVVIDVGTPSRVLNRMWGGLGVLRPRANVDERRNILKDRDGGDNGVSN